MLPYFKDQSLSIISYTYTIPIATQIFNYKKVFQDLNIDDFMSKRPECTCASTPFIYNLAGYVITGDLNIFNNTSLRNVFAKESKYREPKSINWKHNFKILMDFVEDYARQWPKREKKNLDTLSEWIKSVKSLISRNLMYFSSLIIITFKLDFDHVTAFSSWMVCSSDFSNNCL